MSCKTFKLDTLVTYIGRHTGRSTWLFIQQTELVSYIGRHTGRSTWLFISRLNYTVQLRTQGDTLVGRLSCLSAVIHWSVTDIQRHTGQSTQLFISSYTPGRLRTCTYTETHWSVDLAVYQQLHSGSVTDMYTETHWSVDLAVCQIVSQLIRFFSFDLMLLVQVPSYFAVECDAHISILNCKINFLRGKQVQDTTCMNCLRFLQDLARSFCMGDPGPETPQLRAWELAQVGSQKHMTGVVLNCKDRKGSM